MASVFSLKRTARVRSLFECRLGLSIMLLFTGHCSVVVFCSGPSWIVVGGWERVKVSGIVIVPGLKVVVDVSWDQGGIEGWVL